MADPNDKPGEDEVLQPNPPAESDGPEDLPPPPTPDQLDNIEFSVARSLSDSPLAVTVADGPIGKAFAPAELIGKLASRIGALVKDIGGSEPMVYAIAPGNSMTIFFGDRTQTDEAQGSLPLGATEAAAVRIADLVESVDDEFMAKALSVGAPMRRYNELAHLVKGEGLTLDWKPRGAQPKRLTPAIATRQHARLQEPPEMTEWDIAINGFLYRVIAEPGADRGSAGIHRFNWSDSPPDVVGHKVLADADMTVLEAALAGGLFRAPVEGRLRIRRPRPEQLIGPEQVEHEWVSIEAGPPEKSGYGLSIDDLLADSDD